MQTSFVGKVCLREGREEVKQSLHTGPQWAKSLTINRAEDFRGQLTPYSIRQSRQMEGKLAIGHLKK